MIGRIKIIPVAAESLGVRSMCTYVQTPDIKILIDPGASLGPRFGLLPHPKEYECLMECRDRITQFADEADIITISHYHYDHITPTFTDYVWNFSDLAVARQICEGKTVLAKDFRNNINGSQRRRGRLFKRKMGNHFKEFIPVDSQVLIFGDTVLKFSHPVPHGEMNTPMGWLLMLSVEYKEVRVIHASDIQGPLSDPTLEALIAQNPNFVYMGGPPLYLMNYRLASSIIEHGLMNARKLVEKVPNVILDHHLLRAEGWRKASNDVFKTAQKTGHKVSTAATFIGKANNNLEPRRKMLYEEDPPSATFNRWLVLPEEKRRYKKPPV